MDASAIPSSQANDEHTTKKRKLDEGEKQIEHTYTIHGNHPDQAEEEHQSSLPAFHPPTAREVADEKHIQRLLEPFTREQIISILASAYDNVFNICVSPHGVM